MSSVQEAAICELIQNKQVIEFYYGSAMRRFEPHLLGYDGDGDLTLNGWQLEGGSGIGWRDFHVDKLSALSTTGETFAGPRPGYDPSDKTIVRVVCCL